MSDAATISLRDQLADILREIQNGEIPGVAAIERILVALISAIDENSETNLVNLLRRKSQ